MARSSSVEEAGDPEELGVGVLDGREHVVHRRHAALGHGADAHRHQPAVLLDQPQPALAVEGLAVHGHESGGFLDVVARHRRLQVFAQVGLQPEEERVAEDAAARLDVAVHRLRAGRVLHPVRDLVRVGAQQQVVAQGRGGEIAVHVKAPFTLAPSTGAVLADKAGAFSSCPAHPKNDSR